MGGVGGDAVVALSSPVAVFVYGTLMPGQRLWPVLAPYAASWREATARARLWDTGLGYPAARFHDDDGADGEVAVVPGVLVSLVPDLVPAALAALDAVEGEGTLYRRVTVDTSAGTAVAYEWLGPTEGMAALPGGWPTDPPLE